MSRLEKKCFIGSAAFHGLLLVIFVFGSAFIGSHQEKTMQAITIIDLGGKMTDQRISTGGSPNGNPTPPPPAKIEQPPPQPPPPKPEPPKVEPKKVEPEVKPEPKKEVVKKPEPRRIEPKKEIVKDTPKEKGEVPVRKETKKTPDKKREVANAAPTRKISTNVVKRSNTEIIQAQIAAQKKAAEEKASREYARQYSEWQRQLQAYNSQIDGVIGGVGKSLGNKTVAVPLGDGGAAYVHYGSAIGEIYRRAVYASRPEGDEDAVAVIRIVVTRNGSVKDADWVRKTGTSVLDKAVERAMKTVRSVPPFPEGATDSERTFTLNIGFEAKRVST
jgi:TonB family protein